MNYVLQGNDPVKALYSGLGQGIGVRQAEQGMKLAEAAARRQDAAAARDEAMHPMRMQQAQLGLEQGQLGLEQGRFQMQQSRQQAARRDAFQRAMAGLAEKGSSATMADFDAVNAEFPEFAKATSEAWQGLDENRRRGIEVRLGQISSAIVAGNIPLAKQLTEEYAAAAEASGVPDQAATARSILGYLEQSPEAALSALGLTASSLGFKWGQEVFKQGAKDQGGFRQATPEEAAQYGSKAGQFGPDGRFYPITPPKGTSIEVDASGNVRIVEGAGVGAASDPMVGDVYNPGEVKSTLELINEIQADPNLERVTGSLMGGGGNDVSQLSVAQRAYYGDAGLALIQKINQLQSRSWLAARQMLKGGGPITDYESRKAEAAVARLERVQGTEEFQEALADLQSAITEGLAKLEKQKIKTGSQSGDTSLKPDQSVPPLSPEVIKSRKLPEDITQEEYNRVMAIGAKIRDQGRASLTPDEMSFLSGIYGRR